MRNRKTIYVVLTLIFTIGFYLYDNFSVEDFQHIATSKTAGKENDFLPTSTTGQIVKHNFYSLSYSEKHEQAEWVAYNLTADHISKSNFKRPYFEKDLKVLSQSAHYKNYKNSGYDKGHLCPAGDRRFSKFAHDETFLTSNITPQNHQFNAGIWNRLEQKARYWATKYKKLYIVTGGVLTNSSKTIGSEKVTVPNMFYKIILDYQEPEIKAIAFLMPHKESNKALYKFVTSIDEIEKLTGIDFFPELEDSLENKLEKSKSYTSWSFR
ncbi:endonuclease G [Lutibacter oricola]|uniref:Endonuclease G n=1 Tax=Lutibacter oricola TaxID=762486 RepID=A0A1H2U566_9FLAO|nr:DNA/RNA non-specific endonuclease [Lutibacter oricola]SDW51211.1 endonuclease G [Lutibacter oricola]